jgi:hypothetical protein
MNAPKTPTIDPRHLGPLEGGPPPSDAGGELFPGAERALGRSAHRKRQALWEQVAPRIAPLLEEGEQVVHVAAALRNPGLGAHLGLGWMALQYYQVALVLTDRRAIELLLTFGGKKPMEQVRSYPWRDLASLGLRWGKLQARPPRGRRVVWTLRTRADRKLVRQIVGHLERRGLVGGGTSTSEPILHCPGCARPLPAKPDGCPACGARFRSPKLAALLSLAFPGAGLFYAGAPVLAVFDLLGELLLLAVFGIALATTPDRTALVAIAGMAGLFLVLTKLESLHVGHLMVSRLQTETTTHRERCQRMLRAGAVASVVALVAVGAAAGRFAPVVDRELDFAAAGPGWEGTREPAEWVAFADDPALRSQWHHDDGWMASVFSYALTPGESFETFRRDFLAGIEQDGRQVLQPARELPGPFEGFQVTQGFEDGADRYAIVEYIVFDRDNNDVHQVLSVVREDESDDASEVVGALLLNGRWLR